MKQCYGKIYPDLSRVEYNQVLAGKVFKTQINCNGLMPRAPQFEYNLEEWEACQKCEQYRSCYDLSNSKLFMRRALTSIR